MRLPNVSIGILSLHGQAPVLYSDDETLVLVELVPDVLAISEPDSVALYLCEFDRLRSAAVFGDEPAPRSIA
jgi:hypothetical protein